MSFFLLVALVVFVILDLNDPVRGLITVSQEPMERLLGSMGKQAGESRQFSSNPQADGPHTPGIAQGPPPQIVSASFAWPWPACAAKVERRRLIFREPQVGQTGGLARSPARTRNSAVFSQAAQRYSWSGMGTPLRNGILCVQRQPEAAGNGWVRGCRSGRADGP